MKKKYNIDKFWGALEYENDCYSADAIFDIQDAKSVIKSLDWFIIFNYTDYFLTAFYYLL